MNILRFDLEYPFDIDGLAEAIAEETPHKTLAGAVSYRFEMPEGAYILTMWQGVLHNVIYQTPVLDGFDRLERNRTLFEHYGEGHEWTEVLDNGFGKRFHRADLKRFALWSYTMDFNTFGTMAFSQAETDSRR